MNELLAAIVVLAAGTYAFRATGPLLRKRWTPSPGLQRTLEVASVVLLAAVAARSATFPDANPGGAALITGVAVAAVLSWLKAPFLVIVGTAVAVTAGLRFAGLG